MSKKVIEIKSLTKFQEWAVQYKEDKSVYFRGHADSTWELTPLIGRAPYNRVDENLFLSTWSRQAVEFKDVHKMSQFDKLAIAQHHGLPTRLLDWTTNPLVSLYFSVINHLDKDGKVFALSFNHRCNEDDDPFKINGIKVFRAHRHSTRMTRQSGIFTVQENPQEAITKSSAGVDKFEEIIIAKETKKDIRSELSYFGINDLSLFPDLDGLSKHMKWMLSNDEYFQK